MKLLRSLPVRTLLVIEFALLSSLTTLAQTASVPARVTQLVDVTKLVTLQGNTHPLARPEFDQGAAPDSLPMERILLVLQRSAEQETALRKLLDEQQIKASPNYHMWLTPEQFGEQFGPADADIQAVSDWLTSQGFQVNRVEAGRTVIEFSGTAGAVRQAFHTEIHKFAVNGQEHWANSSDPQIPAALKPVVAGFASLNNFPREPMIHRLGTFSRSKATGEVQPLFTYPVSCGSGTCYYLAVGPGDFATIYNVTPLWSAGTDGTGQTIAVVGETNINPQDVADFRAMFGLPVNPPNIILNGPDPGINRDEVEADLDVQWSGAVAKGATIDLVVSESTETTAGIDLSALYIVDNNLAPVMSESYGACEAELGAGGNQFHSTLWEQAAAQGITVLIAAGDSGSAGCDSANFGETAAQYGLAVSGLASTAFNVAVGGTDFNVDSSDAWTYWNVTNTSPSQSSAKSYIPESTWNDSCAASGSVYGCTPPPSTTLLNYGVYLIAGGGGPSNCINPTGTFPTVTCSGNYPKPSWQSGTGVPNDSARDIPDVSLFAGNGMHYSFYVICQMDANPTDTKNSCDLNSPYTNFQAGAGTSASAQVFAGIMALVNQKTGERQGNANYVLYPLAAKSGASCNSSTAPITNSSCIFYDVTVGNNSVICQGGTPNCSNTDPTSGQYGIMVSGSPASAAYATTTGYNLATGLGSVNVANLVNKWTSNFTPSTTNLSLSTDPATNPITLTHGQPVNFIINIAPGSGSGTPTGDVSLIAQTGNSPSNNTGIGPFTLSGGSVSNSTTMLPGGSYNVTAHYAGNGTFAASDSSPGIPVTVGKESSLTEVRLVTFSGTAPPAYNVTTAPYGSPYVLRMDVTNSSGQLCASATNGLVSYQCPTGALTVSPAPIEQSPPPGTVAGSYTLNSLGYAEDQPIQQTPGTYNFTASYAGDNSYTGSTSPTTPITISPAPTTTTLTDLPSSAVVGSNFNCTVTVNTQSTGVAPSPSVQLMNGSTWVQAGAVFSQTNGSATAYASLLMSLYPILPPGQFNLTAQFPGDSYYAASTSSPAAITVTDYSMSANPNAINIPAPGQSGTSTITITPLYGFTGAVSLYCATGAPGVTCTVSPASFNVTGSSPLTATLTVTTTAQASATPSTPQQGGPPSGVLKDPLSLSFHGAPGHENSRKLFFPKARFLTSLIMAASARAFQAPASLRLHVGWLWFLVGLLALATLMSLAAARRRATGLVFATYLLVVGVWMACGGGGGGGSSPPIPAPLVSMSPGTLFFGQQKAGSTSAAETEMVSNTGNASLSISGISIGGANPGDFAQTNTCTTSVAAGSNCSISATFTPLAAGSRGASLTITDNASSSPQTVNLTGTGMLVVAAGVSPTSLSFGRQNLGTTSAAQSVTLSSTGNAPLNINSIAIGGTNPGDFLQTNTCGNSLAAGANCTINVTFAPTVMGSRNASLAVSDNASDSPQMVPLTGTGLQATPPGNYEVGVTGSTSMGLAVHSVLLSVNVQ